MAYYDVTVDITPDLVVWPTDSPVKTSKVMELDKGDSFTSTHLDMGAHTGTHVDAPAHFIKGGATIESMDLSILIGPALVVDLTHLVKGEHISGKILQKLNIEAGTERILFKTSNSLRWENSCTDFYQDYIAVEESGARWLVEHGVKLVGVDYLSVAPFHQIVDTHRVLLGSEIIPLECLNLSNILPGRYQLICLPMKITGSDGAPVRAVLADLDY